MKKYLEFIENLYERKVISKKVYTQAKKKAKRKVSVWQITLLWLKKK